METSSTWAQYPKRCEDSQQAELCSHCAQPYTEKSLGAFQKTEVSGASGSARNPRVAERWSSDGEGVWVVLEDHERIETNADCVHHYQVSGEQEEIQEQTQALAEHGPQSEGVQMNSGE